MLREFAEDISNNKISQLATLQGGKFYLYYMKKWSSYLSIDPDIRFGKPCIKNTRIAIVDILKWLASGMSHAEILEDYPSLTEDHIRAVLMFAANRESIIKIIAA